MKTNSEKGSNFTEQKSTELYLYNWKGIYKVANGDCKKIIRLFKILTELSIPNKAEMKLIRKYHLTFGDKKFSYILNIKSLLLDKTVTESDKCFIIYLASYRSLYDYKLYGITALPLDIAEKLVDINLLKYNKLYKIDENNLILINN